MGYIYTITNKTDNKTYVGQTVQDVEMRWKDHLKKRSNCRYLKSAFNKYGVDNFVFKLVCITFDDKLDDMEIKYIEKYNCLVPKGYNLRIGGNNGRHHAETKQKISESLFGKKNTLISKIKSHDWIIITPDGKELLISNLKKFCFDNNLDRGHMFRVANGTRNHHKGYKCRYP